MVKIRLRRMGCRHRPFYRIVVAPSTAPRNGKFKELLGTYDPLKTPSEVKLDKERALYWLMTGAQPTETVAYLLKREGVLQEFFSKRPKAESGYKFLDKRTATMTKKSVLQDEPAAAAPPTVEAAPAEPATAPAEAAPQAEAPVVPSADAETPAEAAPQAEAPVVPSADAETPAEPAEAAPPEEDSVETPVAAEPQSEKSE